MSNVKMWLITLALVVFCISIYFFKDVYALFLTAAIIAYLLNPLKKFLIARFKMKNIFATAIVVFGTLIAIITAIILIVPSLVDQIYGLAETIPSIVDRLREILENVQNYFLDRGWDIPITEYTYNLIANSGGFVTDFVLTVFGILIKNSSIFMDIVIIIIIAFYFVSDGEAIINTFFDNYAKGVKKFITGINGMVWSYFKSQAVLAFGMAVVTYIGLLMFGVKYALLFAILAFVCDFIPVFGSIFAGAVATLVSLLTGGWQLALGVGIFIIIVQQLEGNVFAPKMQGDSVGIHPVTVIFVLLAANKIWGPMGMFIAVPLAALIKLIVKEIYYNLYKKN